MELFIVDPGSQGVLYSTVLLGILGLRCAPGSPNPDPISDQNKMSIPTPVFRHTLSKFPRKPYPITDQNQKILYPFSEQNGSKTLPFGVCGIHDSKSSNKPPPSK